MIKLKIFDLIATLGLALYIFSTHNSGWAFSIFIQSNGVNLLIYIIVAIAIRRFLR